MAPSDPKAETDFRELLRAPQKLFGYGYIYFLGAAVLLGVLYVQNLSTIGSQAVAPLIPADSVAYATDIPMKPPAVLPPVDVTAAAVPSDSMIARGQAIYQANCASCHGGEGRGDGPAGAVLNPRPRNFHSLAGWTNGPKISQIYRTLEEGIVRNGMASYSHLPPADRFALAHVIRSFAAGAPEDTPGELQALETTYQLSKGKNAPGQIPVRRAQQIVVREGSAGVAAVRDLVARVQADSADPAAGLLKASASDLGRVLTAFRLRGLTDPSAYSASVARDPASAGFRPSVARLSTADWNRLQAYLAGLIQPREGGKPS